MAQKCKIKDCRRCNGIFFETKEEEARRNFLGAAVICEVCTEEWEQLKKERGMFKLQYIGYTEPFMW